MTRKHTFILLLTALTLVTACTKDNDSLSEEKKMETLTWDSQVREYAINITGNSSWVAHSNVKWCAPLKSTGKGATELKVMVSPNLTAEARQGLITITTTKGIRTIQVTQPAYTGNVDKYEYRLPVMFHVMYKDAGDEQQNVSQRQLNRIMTEVNKLYAANGTDIQFEMAKYDDEGNTLAEAGIMRHQVDFNECDPETFLNGKTTKNKEYAKYQQNLRRCINIYLFKFQQDKQGNQTLGISNLAIVAKAHPLDSLFATDALNNYCYTDSPRGCCIDNTNINSWQEEGTLSPTYIVTTVAHELGHYLGLLHTFSQEGCDWDDACDDTHISDYEDYINYLTWLAKTATQTGNPLYISDVLKRTDCKTSETFKADNIMDYTYTKANTFSPQQRARIRHILKYGTSVPGPKLLDLPMHPSVTTRSTVERASIPVSVQLCPPTNKKPLPIRGKAL